MVNRVPTPRALFWKVAGRSFPWRCLSDAPPPRFFYFEARVPGPFPLCPPLKILELPFFLTPFFSGSFLPPPLGDVTKCFCVKRSPPSSISLAPLCFLRSRERREGRVHFDLPKPRYRCLGCPFPSPLHPKKIKLVRFSPFCKVRGEITLPSKVDGNRLGLFTDPFAGPFSPSVENEGGKTARFSPDGPPFSSGRGDS